MSAVVSIVIPYHNAEETLARCCASLAAQEGDVDFEAILVDDASTDGSAQIGIDVVRSDRRMCLVQKEEHTGLVDALNLGLQSASGEWLCFFDVRDWFAPAALDSLRRAALSPSCSIAVAGFYRVEGGRFERKDAPDLGLVSRSWFVKLMAEHPSDLYFSSVWNKLFRRSFISEYGLSFDGDLSAGAEYAFVLDCLRCADRVATVSEPMLYRTCPASSLADEGWSQGPSRQERREAYPSYLRLLDEVGLYEDGAQSLRRRMFLSDVAGDAGVSMYADDLDSAAVPGADDAS